MDLLENVNHLEQKRSLSAMNIFTKWGCSKDSWRGLRGEYWFAAQAVLILGFLILPVYHPAGLNIHAAALSYFIGGVAVVLELGALILLIQGLRDLGENLTPLPHPRDDGQLVQTGIYRVVRHPLYSGLVLAALGYAIAQQSLSHLAAAAVLFIFLNAKATQEEIWLTQKYPAYSDYQNQVKKLIPWLY